MLRLPEDIIMNILRMLPAESLLQIRLVCKSWCNFINNPNFVKMHLNHTIEENNFNLILKCYLLKGYSLYSTNSASFDEAVEINYPLKPLNYNVQMLCSCNGLICISPDRYTLCLWNPSTNEYKEMPTPPISNPKFPSDFGLCNGISYGLGYDCKNEDYKLVRLVGFVAGYGCDVQVYKLGSNSWKTIEGIRYGLYYVRPPMNGVFVNGCLHWIVTPFIESKASKVIISFDIGKERFQELLLPEHLDDEFDSINLCVLGGCLCLFSNVYTTRTEVWVMKDYGVRESWTKLFIIDQQKLVEYVEYLSPIQSLKSGDILLEMDDDALVLYDPNHEKLRVLNIHDIPMWFRAESYLRSLVSLNSGTFVGQEQTEEAIEHRKSLKENIMRYDWTLV